MDVGWAFDSQVFEKNLASNAGDISRAPTSTYCGLNGDIAPVSTAGAATNR